MAFSIGKGYGLQYQKPSALSEGKIYIKEAAKDGYSGGSAACAQEFFTTLDSIA